MFFHGNFALISPASLIQVFCQEQRSVVITAQRGHTKATIQIYEGLIVGASCDSIVGPDAIYRIAAWESGQFEIALMEEPDITMMMAAGWEELLLEAARQRDETEAALSALPPYPTRSQIDKILSDSPALAGVALVGYDGRLLAAVGLDEELVVSVTALALGLASVGQSLGGGQGVALYVGNGRKLLVGDWRGEAVLLGLPMPGASIGEASSQIAAQTVQVVA